MRRGIFGGTFDPPHVGHLLVASDACDALRLDQLAFVPNARQPLKAGQPVAPADARLEMLRAALKGDGRFTADPCEVERGGTSYSVDTLSAFAARFPADERFFVVGADVGATFARWREPERVLSLARLVVLRRATDAPDDTAILAPFLAVRGAEAHPPVVIPTRRVDVSSTEIRERVRRGLPLTGFVPDAVARVIMRRGLYQPALS